MYSALKLVHLLAAILSIAGFTLRGIWMLRESPLLRTKPVRIMPHVNDTIFLLSGIGLIRVLALPVIEQPWLVIKLLAVVVYICLGMIALRFGRTKPARAIAFFLALATFAYAAGVALGKSPFSWLAIAFA